MRRKRTYDKVSRAVGRRGGWGISYHARREHGAPLAHRIFLLLLMGRGRSALRNVSNNRFNLSRSYNRNRRTASGPGPARAVISHNKFWARQSKLCGRRTIILDGRRPPSLCGRRASKLNRRRPSDLLGPRPIPYCSDCTNLVLRT